MSKNESMSLSKGVVDVEYVHNIIDTKKPKEAWRAIYSYFATLMSLPGQMRVPAESLETTLTSIRSKTKPIQILYELLTSPLDEAEFSIIPIE